MISDGNTKRDNDDAPKAPRDQPSDQPTTDPALTDPEKTPGSGMFPDTGGDAPSG
jgi:hypothetical protein